MRDDSRDSADRLADLVDVLMAELDAGREVDAVAMARKFDIEADEVERCLEGLRGLHALADDSLQIEFDFEEDQTPVRLPDDYEVVDELGRGGMGIVFRAHQKSLDRDVALKILRPGEQAFARSIARFRQEAKALARLSHPNIVTIHEVGEIDGHVYFTMDLIEGRSLDRVLKKEKMTPARAVKLVRQVAAAISYTHERGLVHRDLKPQNILIDESDVAHVTDFGLVLNLDEHKAGLTQTGQILGTPSYMSPEQARGDSEAIGEATDIWAMGVVLYECLCGRTPFSNSSPIQALHEVIHADPEWPRKVNKTCPPELEALCLRALEKDPAKRYPTAQAFLEDLERFAEGRPVRARRVEFSTRMWRSVKRQAVPITAALASAAALLAFFAVTIFPRLGNDPDTARAIGDELWRKGNREAALGAYERAFEEGSNDAELFDRIVTARRDRARSLRREGRADEARELLLRTQKEGERRHAARKILLGPDQQATRWNQAVGVVVDLAAARVAAGEVLAPGPTADRLWALINQQSLRGADIFNLSVPRRPYDLGSFLLPLLDDEDQEVRRWARSLFPHIRYSFLDSLVSLARHHRGFFSIAEHPPETQQLGSFSESVASRVDDTLCEEFATLLEPGELPASWRPQVAYHLAAAADLPDRFAFGKLEDWTESRIASLLDAWKGLSETDREGRRQLRLQRATTIPGSHLHGGAEWFRLLAAAPTQLEDHEAIRRWWHSNTDVDPALHWAKMSGLKVDTDAEVIVQSAFNLRRKERAAAGRLLAWQRGAGAPRPMDLENAAAWRDLLNFEKLALGEAVRLRLSVFATVGRRIRDYPEAEYVLPFSTEFKGPGKSDIVSADYSSPILSNLVPEFGAAVPPLGFHQAALGKGRDRLQITAQLVGRDGEVELQFPDFVETQTYMGRGHSRSSGSGKDLKLGAVGLVRGALARRVDPNPKEHLIVLAFADTSVDKSKAWGLAEWRRRLAKDIAEERAYFESLDSEGRDSAQYERGNRIRQLSVAAAVLGVPDAAPDLRALWQIHASFERNMHSQHVLFGAMIAAGESEALKEIESRELFEHEAAITFGRLPLFWLHQALNSPSDAARALAWKKLQAEDLPEAYADHIAIAYRNGAEIPKDVLVLIDIDAGRPEPTIVRAVKSKPRRAIVPVIIWLLVLAGLTLLLFKRRRQIGAVTMIFAGILMASFYFDVGGVDWLPDALGWGLAAFGAALIAQTTLQPWRYLAAVGFLTAAVLDFSIRSPLLQWIAPFFPIIIVGFAQLAGLVGLAVLAFRPRIDRIAQGRVFGAFPMRLWGYVGLLLVAAAFIPRLLGFEAKEISAVVNLLFALLLILGCVVGLKNRGSRGRPQVPTFFTILVVCPSAFILLALAIQVAAGHEEAEVKIGDIALFFPIVVAVCLLVVFIELSRCAIRDGRKLISTRRTSGPQERGGERKLAT